MNKLRWGLLAVPISIFGRVTHNDTLVFVAAFVAILPLAGLMGKATEEIAIQSGPRVGGFLNATFGNAAELIIALFLLAAGEIEVVKASITGSIIGNLLLVLGASFLVGGIKFREQQFSEKVAGMHSASMVLAVVGLMMPALFHRAVPNAGLVQDEVVSVGVAAILMLLYVSSVVFSFATHQEEVIAHVPHDEPTWSKSKAIVVLVIATAFVALESEFIVHSLQSAAESLGLSRIFIGLILVPIVGNAAEHSSAITLAAKNHTDVSIEIAVGSSTQIAMFIAPLLVFVSLAIGKPMDFFFTGFEVAAVGFSAAIVAIIAGDGRSNWLEGAQLIAAYLIMALSFFFLPALTG